MDSYKFMDLKARSFRNSS